MSFGSAPKPPAAQPQTPVPQDDDPNSLIAKQKAAALSKSKEGDSAHLLSGSKDSVSTDMSADPEAQKVKAYTLK